MAAHAARRLTSMNRNLNTIIGVELMCAAQGVEFRAPLKTSPDLQQCMKAVREKVSAIEHDRYLATDIQAAAWLVADGALVRAAGLHGHVIGRPDDETPVQ